ncbi:MAG: hypothetical protein PHD95_01895 [Candidatus ainarchaeum sp.]|nr:hypothetical protein [Candidatus ainarchaeum sp.]
MGKSGGFDTIIAIIVCLIVVAMFVLFFIWPDLLVKIFELFS